MGKSGVDANKLGVPIIPDNIEILSDLKKKSGCVYYTWGVLYIKNYCAFRIASIETNYMFFLYTDSDRWSHCKPAGCPRDHLSCI